MRTMKQHYPLIASLMSLIVILMVIFQQSIRLTDGYFIYGLDDAYIHMAIAKNFSQYGVWGVTPFQFSSSTSSILWTLFISVLFSIFGTNDLTPLIANFIVSLAGLFCVYILFDPYMSKLRMLLLLHGLVFLTPITPLIFGGMEHVLQIICTIGLAWLLSQKIATKERVSFGLLALAAFAVLVRYESLYIIAAFSIFLLCQRRIKELILLAAAAVLPISIYGLLSMGNGWYFLPNSLLLKGAFHADIAAFFTLGVLKLALAPHLSLLLLAAVVLLLAHRPLSFSDQSTVFSFGFLLTSCAHALTASVGWFYRYEAYLVVWGLVIICLMIQASRSWKLVFQLAPAVLAVLFLAWRGFFALNEVPLASEERYLEHYLPAQMVSQYFNSETVVANDIGALCFYSDIQLLDMYGLGSIEPIVYRRATYGKEEVYEWAASKDAKIAILQTEWVEIYPRIPEQWTKVATWTIPHNVVFGDTTVSIFAIDPNYSQRLHETLVDFAPSLPKEITIRYH